jgi:hypothetical protein
MCLQRISFYAVDCQEISVRETAVLQDAASLTLKTAVPYKNNHTPAL